METVINLVRGDALKADNCIFCGETKNCKFFGIESDKTYDGIIIKHFGVCSEHLAKINSLLSGKFDIDRIYLEKYRKTHQGRGVRLR